MPEPASPVDLVTHGDKWISKRKKKKKRKNLIHLSFFPSKSAVLYCVIIDILEKLKNNKQTPGSPNPSGIEILE